MPAHARFWHTPRASVGRRRGRAGYMALLGRGRYAAAAGHRGSVRETAGCDRRNRALQAARTQRTSYVWSDGWQNTADGHGTSSTGGHRFREPWSAFSLHTSAPEYARLVVAMMADEDAEAMFEPAARVDDEPGWGLGFGLSGDGFWHWGDG